MPGEPVAPQAVCGHQLLGVVASWYKPDDPPVAELVHVWLHVDGVGFVKCHTKSGIALLLDDPHDPYEMPELRARVDVEPGTPAPLAKVTGATIIALRRLVSDPQGFDIGYALETTRGTVAVVDIGDDLAIGEWPDESRWATAGVALGD